MSTSTSVKAKEGSNARFLVDLSRAFGGALVFSFPMLMTMEMWWLGFYLSGFRLAIFTFLAIPLLIGLSFYDGFEDTFTGKDDIRETFVAYWVGFTASTVLLFLFGVIQPFHMSLDEIIGKISIQAVPASLGAMFAQSILGGDTGTEHHAERRKRSARYAGQLFLMLVGALFLSMSVSPTEEMVLIAYQMTYMHSIGLAILTIVIMHAFVYGYELRRKEKEKLQKSTPFYSLFLRFTLAGYGAVLLISLYVLWTFGSIDDMQFSEKLKSAIVLGFPAAVGASASRLIL